MHTGVVAMVMNCFHLNTQFQGIIRNTTYSTICFKEGLWKRREERQGGGPGRRTWEEDLGGGPGRRCGREQRTEKGGKAI